MTVSWRFSSWPLRAKMAALLAVASLLPLAIWAYIDFKQDQARLLDSMKFRLEARGDLIVRELDAFHLGYARSIDRIARWPNAAAFCSAKDAHRTVIGASLLGSLSSFPLSDAGIRGVALIDGSGRVSLATETSLVGVDLSGRPNMRLALQGQKVISDLYVSSPQSGAVPTIAYLAPIVSPDRKVLCVAALWVRATALWDVVKTSNALAGPGSFAVLFDRQGIRIAHTYSDDIVFHPGGRLDPALVDKLVAERRFGVRTRALLEDVRAFPDQFDRARAASPDLSVFRGFAPVNQSWNYGVARRFETVSWTVFYMVPEAAFTAQLAQAARERLLLAAAIIVVAGLAGLFVATSILRPIRALSKATASLADGDLAARVLDDRGDELGQLGVSFNAMAGRIQMQAENLRQARDELEQRVKDRTSELEVEIAERKRAEASIRESQELLQAIIDNSAAVIYVKDLQGRYLLVNRRYLELFHVESDTIVGKSDHDLFPKDTADTFRAMDVRVAAASAPLTEEELVPHDGAEHTYVSVKCPLRDRHGQVYGVFGISTDITARKLAESRLQAQLERMQLLNQITTAIGERQDLQSIYQVTIRSLEEQLPVDFSCVCRYDVVDNVLTVIRVGIHSQALAMELAMTEQSHIAIDQNGLSRCIRGELVYEQDTLAIPAPFPQWLARGGLQSVVIAPLQVEGRVFGILVAARRKPQSFSSGDCEFLRQLTAHVALAAQQTELHAALQRAYDDLRQTQQASMQQERLRALGQMASGIAHDINNAISPAALYTENLLEHEPNLSEQARSQLTTIARAIDDVAATVARMREFYRQREPQVTLTPVQLNPLVQQVLDLTRARWSDMPQQRGAVIRLVSDLAPDLPNIMGVENEVREALINLVFNAVDAMPEGGVLTLRTRRSGVRSDASGKLDRFGAWVEVIDTGVGMDDETRRRCLEPFFTTKGERGTGLGLAMVYGVVQRHGADVEIDSAAGSGTAVRIRFPIPMDASMSTPSEVPPEVPPTGLRILIVDDDPLILKSLRDTLEPDGHIVTSADGGQAGIDAFRAVSGSRDAFDVVITDLGMPYVDGRRVASAVKESAAAPPVILLTGWGQGLAADGDFPAHVDTVLSKPPKLREIRAALAELTRRSSPATIARPPGA